MSEGTWAVPFVSDCAACEVDPQFMSLRVFGNVSLAEWELFTALGCGVVAPTEAQL